MVWWICYLLLSNGVVMYIMYSYDDGKCHVQYSFDDMLWSMLFLNWWWVSEEVMPSFWIFFSNFCKPLNGFAVAIAALISSCRASILNIVDTRATSNLFLFLNSQLKYWTLVFPKKKRYWTLWRLSYTPLLCILYEVHMAFFLCSHLNLYCLLL